MDNEKYKIELIDTAGQDQFRALIDSTMQTSNAFIFTYSTTSKHSLEQLSIFVQKFCQFRDDMLSKLFHDEKFGYNAKEITRILPVVFVGTKSDLTGERQVSKDEAYRKALQIVSYMEESNKPLTLGHNLSHSIPIIETSAKLGTNVQEAFSLALRQALLWNEFCKESSKETRVRPKPKNIALFSSSNSSQNADEDL